MSVVSGRINKTSDREEVYKIALSSFRDNPFFGTGAIKIEYFEHAHNSYLHVVSRYGIFAFLLWIALVYRAYFRGIHMRKNIDFILIFIVLSMSQIGLQSPNVLAVFTILRYFLQYRPMNHKNTIYQDLYLARDELLTFQKVKPVRNIIAP